MDNVLSSMRESHLSSPLLTVIIPVYNEALTLDALLRRVVAAPYDKQILIINDGSTDGTRRVLEGWADRPGVEVLAHAYNRGKGAAIRSGLGRAIGEFTIVQDADLEYDPQDYVAVIEPLRVGSADMVFLSRYM